MTTNLAQELITMAEESTNYAKADVVLAAVRRRRRRMLAAPIAGGLAVLMTAGVIVAQRLEKAPPGPQRVAVSPLVLPPVVVPPSGDVPLLPDDQAVGRAVLVYRPCEYACPTYLLTASGADYRIDVDYVNSGFKLGEQPWKLLVSLSPDGRWLGIEHGYTTTVRDLTGTLVYRESGPGIGGWSPDSRYALAGLVRLDTTTGATAMLPFSTIGVADSGELITGASPFTSHYPNPHTVIVFYTAASTSDGTRSAEITGSKFFDAEPVLHPGEAVAPMVDPELSGNSGFFRDGELAYGPDNQVAMTIFHGASMYPPGSASDPDPARLGVAVGNAATGAMTTRAALPPGADTPFFLGDQLVYAVQATRNAPIDLYGIVSGGNDVLLSTLPPESLYLAAGMLSGHFGPAGPDGPGTGG